MPDVYSKSKRSEIMSLIRCKDTRPEVTLRKNLHRLGYRYRCNVNTLPGKPDIVLPKYQTTIQVRGCFWHGHTCIDGHIPHSRQDYWKPKLAATKKRDRKNDRKLRELGWSVLVVWECRVSSAKKLEKQIQRITNHLEKRLMKLPEYITVQ